MELTTTPSHGAVEAVTRAANEIAAHCDDPWKIEEYLLHHRDRIALDYEWMRQTCKDGERICELGAYPFFLTRALVQAGMMVYPVNIPDPAAATAAAAARVSAIHCNIETQSLPFPDEYFDHVLLNEVFEHLRIDLVFTMGEILRVLKRSGRLWLSTPNLRSLRGIANLVFKGEAYASMGEGLYYQYKSLQNGHMGHVREYTSNEVTAFLIAVGFGIEKVIYRGSYRSRAARLLTAVVPGLKPYFSVLACRK